MVRMQLWPHHRLLAVSREADQEGSCQFMAHGTWGRVPALAPRGSSRRLNGCCLQRKLGWVGLGQGLAWSPTRGPRRLPCRT